MKTIIITSFHPHISRNILATDFLSVLRLSPDTRVVIVTADYKVGYFKKIFGGSNVFIEGVKMYQSSRTFRGNVFKKMGMFLFDSETARLKKRYQYYCEGKYGYYLFGVIARYAGRSVLVRRFVRFLDARFSPKGFFAHILLMYRPDLLFSTDIQNENDVSFMFEARAYGIPVIGMIRSWDNPSQRILRVLPDHLFVGSITLRDEVTGFYRYPASKISVVGTPHHDRYLKGPKISRGEFCHVMGLDPARPFLLYAPVGDALIRSNDIDQHIMQVIAQLGIQILVRFPPDESVKLTNFVRPSHMVYDRPGIVFKDQEFADREISVEDDQRLIDALYHAKLVISGPTSIPLDAALIDKPSILVHFYPVARGFCQSVYSFDAAHIKKLIATGGVSYVRSKDELFRSVKRYIADPGSDRAGRARIRSLWFSHADGRAGERTAREILTFAKKFRLQEL